MRMIPLVAVVFTLACYSDKAYGQPIETVGGCLIIHLRNTQYSAPDLSQTCSRYPRFAGGSTPHYAWAVPFLAASFDGAERGYCGYPGCATANKHVRIVLVNDGLANASISSRTATSVDVGITGGLIDFAEATTRAVLAETSANRAGIPVSNGYIAWLATMRSISGASCRFSVPMPATTLDIEKNFQDIRVGAQTIYIFVFAHELAHLRAGPRCGASATATTLEVERQCDRMAIDALLARSISAPTLTALFLTAMAHYEALVGPILAPIGSTVSWAQGSPARDWINRGEQLLDRMTAVCGAGSTNAACHPGWEEAVELTRDILRVNPPSPCSRNVAPTESPEYGSDAQFKSALDRFVADAGSRFRGTRGSFEDVFEGDSIWTAAIVLPGAHECSVWGGSDPYVTCAFAVSDDAAMTDAAYTALKDRITRWLPPGWILNERQDTARSGMTRRTLVATRTPDGLEVTLTRTQYTSGNARVNMTVALPE